MKKRVMLADDSMIMRKIEKDILENAGFEIVAEAKNGVEAVALYRFFKPDIVLMDITMPELTGLEALAQILNDYPEARVIMCSAVAGQKSYVMDALEHGAIDIIVKPFEKSFLADTVKKNCKIEGYPIAIGY